MKYFEVRYAENYDVILIFFLQTKLRASLK